MISKNGVADFHSTLSV